MPFLLSRFPALYRFAALLALLAMLAPVGAMAAHHPVVQSLVHICGMDQPTSGDHGKSAPVSSCPICFSLHLLGGGFVPPDAVVVVAAPITPTLYIVRRYEAVRALTPTPQSRPRAPPTLV